MAERSKYTIGRGRTCCALALLVVVAAMPSVTRGEGGFWGQSQSENEGDSSRAQKEAAINSLPMQRLTREAQARILSIAGKPTIYRRLPTQMIDCDRDMFLFLSRNPEVLVAMWDLMGITNVQISRTGPYQMEAVDGSGTTCQVDLVYGDPNLHVFVASGSYDGPLVAKPITGNGVFILTSRYAESASGRTTVTGTLDCFLQLESLGADLIARTLSGLIGRSADNNFTETAKFIAQVSQASEKNPQAMLDVASRLPQVTEPVRGEFVTRIVSVARNGVERGEQDEQDARVAQKP
ncbi:MAG: hypothetical protein WBD31_23215 [Rubripirellula sp.]